MSRQTFTLPDLGEGLQEAEIITWHVKPGEKIHVVNTLSRHNIGVGLPPGVDISFEGSVGYYCGGLNTGATISIERNAGWGLGEGMSDGHIRMLRGKGMPKPQLHWQRTPMRATV